MGIMCSCGECSNLNWENFLKKVYLLNESEFELRLGQSIINVLYSFFPCKYKKISYTDFDCFYDEDRVPQALQELKKNW